jgi:hypothetical protein
MKTKSELIERVRDAVKRVAAVDLMPDASLDRPDDTDGVVSIRFRGASVQMPYIARYNMNTSTVHIASLIRRHHRKGLLAIASHVNSHQAAALRAADVNFADAAGNVFLDKPAGLFLMITGQRADEGSVAQGVTRAFHPSGLKLIFSLLTDPDLDSDKLEGNLVSQSYRDIGTATGISHSTVGWIMADLINQGFVVLREDGSRMLADRKRILEQWTQAYIDRLRPGLRLARYRPGKMDWWKDVDPRQGLWSGEVAAAKMTGQLKPGTMTLFGDVPSHDFVLQHNLQKDPDGTVEFLKPFWPRDWNPTKTDCVHPLLIYADLLAINDDRTREVAQMVYGKYLRSLIETD